MTSSLALARPTDEQISRLGGPDLTPFGAERKGNADGTIPEWTGGISQPPPGWTWEKPRIDLFADDKVLFTIDAANVDQYADKLSPGQVALIKAYEGYTMDVYPTRRSCTLPSRMVEVVKENARVASHSPECLLTGGVACPLFPLPENGCQVIQNGRPAQFNGTQGFDRNESQVVPTKGGSYEPTVRKMKVTVLSWMPKYPTFESLNGMSGKVVTINYAPPKKAGEITLAHSLMDGHIKAWTYNPGQRRVRRNPNFEYDNPNPAAEGLTTVDQVNGYNGAADRYDWKLVGKQEMYIPYNSEKFGAADLTYQDMIRPRYPRRDLMRYELHRVWVVEATVRADRRHMMPRRVFYLDEDSWVIAVTDAYDSRGGLWRVSEHLARLFYELPACMPESSVFFDLAVGRYLVSPIMNQGPVDYLAGEKGTVSQNGFEPDDLRRMGVR